MAPVGRNGRKKVMADLVDRDRLARARAERKTPILSRHDMKVIFGSPEAREILNIKRDVAAFGALVREWRRIRALTQAELAEASGISRATIAAIEAGCMEGGPRIATVARLLRACGQRLVPSVADAEGSIVAFEPHARFKEEVSYESHRSTSAPLRGVRLSDHPSGEDRPSDVSDGAPEPARRSRRGAKAVKGAPD